MIGQLIDNRYTIIELLGEGGFGAVYKVIDNQDESEYALKVCKVEDEDFRKRFAREVRLMEAIEAENVVSILNSNLENEPPYFVMPLAEKSLKEDISRLQHDEKEALNFFLKVCDGIQRLHTSKIIHRDIKPENVLIYPEGRIVVSDLGLGKFETRDSTILTNSDIYIGTEGYIPPEYKINRGTKNADKRGDVYQLGKMLYYILTGKNPLLIDNSALSPSLLFIVQKAIKENPNERFQSVGEFMDAIKSYLYATDPDSNPIKKFEAKINALKDLVRKEEYDPSLLSEVLQVILLTSRNDQQAFFDYFDELPELILEVCSNQAVDHFEPVFLEYTNQLLDYIDSIGANFVYAETVAEKMRLIYINSANLTFKVWALKNILIASVFFHRYRAMDIFSEILLSIKEDEEAFMIANVLKEEKRWFQGIASRLEKRQLHVAIQKVIEDLEE